MIRSLSVVESLWFFSSVCVPSCPPLPFPTLFISPRFLRGSFFCYLPPSPPHTHLHTDTHIHTLLPPEWLFSPFVCAHEVECRKVSKSIFFPLKKENSKPSHLSWGGWDGAIPIPPTHRWWWPWWEYFLLQKKTFSDKKKFLRENFIEENAFIQQV